MPIGLRYNAESGEKASHQSGRGYSETRYCIYYFSDFQSLYTAQYLKEGAKPKQIIHFSKI